MGRYRFVRLSLDALPEFGSRALEVLRQPIEDKLVTISRAQGTLTFPANFQLIAAMNHCPCGYYGDAVKSCTCSAFAVFGATITKYQNRISGPLLDRIDDKRSGVYRSPARLLRKAQRPAPGRAHRPDPGPRGGRPPAPARPFSWGLWGLWGRTPSALRKRSARPARRMQHRQPGRLRPNL